MIGGAQSNEVDRTERQRRDVLSSIWAQVTSDVGAIFAPDTATPTTTTANKPDASTHEQPAPTSTVPSPGEMTTMDEVVPVSTVTVERTSLSTTFVTVPFTTTFSPTYAPATTAPATTSTTKETDTDTDTCTSSSSTSPPPSHTLESSTFSFGPLPLPTIISSARPPDSSASPTPGPSAQNNSSASTAAEADESASQGSQKHAIIGGLSGSIAGLVLIGVIVCLLWRRRKPKFDDDDSASEKGFRPMFARKWSEMSGRARALQPPPPAMTRRSTPTPEPDGQIIRVSLDNWARPYAHDEGYRESRGPTTLRVMNPDAEWSRPSTPIRPSLETAGSFLKRQRNALAAALYGRPSSRADSPHRNLQVPASNIDPALSTEFLASKATAPSVRSGTTTASTAIVVHQAPADPFLTPPDEMEERAEYTTRPQPAARPGVTPLQGAAAVSGVGRSLSHLGSSLNPFRTRSNASASSRSASRHSTSTFSSAGDPFHLQSGYTYGGPVHEMERGPSANVMMYEGT